MKLARVEGLAYLQQVWVQLDDLPLSAAASAQQRRR
jgi:hypothetical protein